MNNNDVKNPFITTNLLVHKEFSGTKHKRKCSARFEARSRSLSLSTTLFALKSHSPNVSYCNDSRTQRQAFSFFSSRCKGRVQKVREGRRKGAGGRGVSNVLCCERKERYVERLWTTTTTNSITDKARQDKGRNYVSKRASDSVHTVLAQRERGRECGREGARGHHHKPVIKRNGNGVLHSSSSVVAVKTHTI
jgi:hypothetical protein